MRKYFPEVVSQAAAATSQICQPCSQIPENVPDEHQSRDAATETWSLAALALATCFEFGVWQGSCVGWSMNCTCGTPTSAPTVPVGLQLLEREGFQTADLRRKGRVRLEELTSLLCGRARVRQQVRTRLPPNLRTFPFVIFAKTTLLLQLRERELQRKKCFSGQEHRRSAPQHERDGCPQLVGR